MQLAIPLAIPTIAVLRGVQMQVQYALLGGGPVFGGSLSSRLSLVIGG